MKYISSILNLVVLTAFLSALSNCGPVEPVETDAEIAKRLLTSGGTWSLQSATVDGVDKTSLYQDLKVSFSASNFTVTSGGAVWPATGSWSISSDGKTIERSDGLQITITELTENRVVMSFAWTKATVGPGRIESVSGQHVFTFTS